jgi:hypothetical protein
MALFGSPMLNGMQSLDPSILAMLAASAGGSPALSAAPAVAAPPSAINVTAPSRYGMAPLIYGGAPMSSLGAPRYNPAPDTPNTPVGSAPVPATPQAAVPGGMFAAQKKGKFDLKAALPVIQMALIAATARHNPLAATEMQLAGNALAAQRKKADEDADTAKYIQALVNQGMDPNQAVVFAADKAEMAKHIGTHFDAHVLNAGDTLATPNLNGTMNAYTAPKTFQNKADVVQMPGSQAVTGPFSSLGIGAAPQPVGAPSNIPGLRTEGQQYADSLGLTPGTPAYDSALQDFELKANGPTAYNHASVLQSNRLATQEAIAAGHDRTSAANNQRTVGASIYGANHRATGAGHALTTNNVLAGIYQKMAQGQPLTPGEQAALTEARTPHKPQRGGGLRVMTAQEASQQPPGTTFLTTDGRVMRVPERQQR